MPFLNEKTLKKKTLREKTNSSMIRLDKPVGSLNSIQYLRAIAAMMVVYHHVDVQFLRLPNGKDGLPLAWLGASGVDIFFVVSGFLMWSTTYGRNIGPWSFMIRRIRRIVPAYWAVTIGVALLAIFVPSILTSTKFDLVHFITSLVFIPHPSPLFPDQLWPVLVPGWTLNYEMFFYLIFGLCLFTPERYRLAVTCLILLGFVLSGEVMGFDSIYFQFYSNKIMIGFLLGVLIGRFITVLDIPVLGSFSAILLGIVLALMTREAHSLAWSFGAALVVLGFVSIEKMGRLVQLPLLRVGNASYSIYLTHVLVLPAVTKLYASALSGVYPSFVFTLSFLVLSLFVSIIFGILFFRAFEDPCDDYLRNLVSRDLGAPTRLQAKVSRRPGWSE